MPTPKRDHLIETAQSLFAREGFKGVAVDRLIAEAGVAKMTLYKGFRTKDELILETLKRRDTHLRNWFMREVTAATTDPKERLLACFDVLETWCGRPDFNGCYFVSALTEFSDEAHPARRAAKEHKRLMLDHIIDLCKATNKDDPEDLARDIRLLMEGATVSKLTLNDVNAFQRAQQIAVLKIRDSPPEGH
jgi:AcrR family transcriptional regulator